MAPNFGPEIVWGGAMPHKSYGGGLVRSGSALSVDLGPISD